MTLRECEVNEWLRDERFVVESKVSIGLILIRLKSNHNQRRTEDDSLFFSFTHSMYFIWLFKVSHAKSKCVFVFFNTARKAPHHTGVTPDSSVVCTLVADC